MLRERKDSDRRPLTPGDGGGAAAVRRIAVGCCSQRRFRAGGLQLSFSAGIGGSARQKGALACRWWIAVGPRLDYQYQCPLEQAAARHRCPPESLLRGLLIVSQRCAKRPGGGQPAR